jgi:hypothetical protein
MYFLVDTMNKVIIGWSAKCACSHIITIIRFLQNMNITVHTENDINILPSDIENYTTLLFIRNPYKRIVSGFLDKYRNNGQYRHILNNKYKTISFSQFVDELITYNYELINKPHFELQTDGSYSKQIFESKTIKFFDIENIDYTFIENLFNKKIIDSILNKKFGHERSRVVFVNKVITKNVYDLNIDELINCNIDTKYFYNEDIKNKIYKFYEKDFILFKEHGFDYNVI